MAKDTQNEPVETIEDEIASVLDAAEESEDEAIEEEQFEEEVEEEAEESVDDGEEQEEKSDPDAEPDEVAEESEESEDETEIAAESDSDDKLDPPAHWSAEDKDRFNACPKDGQEFLLKRHKEMEAHFTKQNQERGDTDRQFAAIRDALSPYEQEFARSGLDYAGAVRQLAHWHQALKSGGKSAVLELAQTYGIDLSEPDDDEFVDPTIRAVQNQVRELKTLTARQQAEAQRQEQQRLSEQIQTFKAETDASGNLLRPHFDALEEDMARLFQAGFAKSLEEGYSKALALRPDLAPKPNNPAPKVDQAEKVKKAKRAATGIKSTGSVVRKPRRDLTLEEEIAANMQ